MAPGASEKLLLSTYTSKATQKDRREKVSQPCGRSISVRDLPLASWLTISLKSVDDLPLRDEPNLQARTPTRTKSLLTQLERFSHDWTVWYERV